LEETARSIASGTMYGVCKRHVGYLIQHAASCLNSRPNSNTAPGETARTLVTGRKLDFTKDLLVSFGEILQWKNPYPKSNAEPRSHYGFVLGRDIEEGQGSCTVYNLETDQIGLSIEKDSNESKRYLAIS
jgi:hypothetical protein